MPLPPPGNSRLFTLATGLLFGLLVVHFIAVSLSVLPSNSVSRTAEPVSRVYLRPFFVQGWQLFAPDPVSGNVRVYVRGTYLSGDGDQETPWLDVLDPAMSKRRRIWPPSNNLIEQVEWEAATLLLNDLSRESGEAAAADPSVITRWADAQAKPPSLVSLESAGGMALRTAYPTLDLRQVQVGLAIQPTSDIAGVFVLDSHPGAAQEPPSGGLIVFRPVNVGR